MVPSYHLCATGNLICKPFTMVYQLQLRSYGRTSTWTWNTARLTALACCIGRKSIYRLLRPVYDGDREALISLWQLRVGP